jgi:hypothetical protein
MATESPPVVLDGSPPLDGGDEASVLVDGGDEASDLESGPGADRWTLPPTPSDAGPGSGADASADSQCECKNLDACCRRVAQAAFGAACRADVARADEAVCRSTVLQGKYGCLALGFAPNCPGADEALCPAATTPCSQCMTAYQNCGPVIQCVVNPACKPAWDAMVECEQQGRPFLQCFDLLQVPSAPGELILWAAQCGETCRGDR